MRKLESTDQLLTEIVRRLVEAYRPERSDLHLIGVRRSPEMSSLRTVHDALQPGNYFNFGRGKTHR
jgi:hypothetical protein